MTRSIILSASATATFVVWRWMNTDVDTLHSQKRERAISLKNQLGLEPVDGYIGHQS